MVSNRKMCFCTQRGIRSLTKSGDPTAEGNLGANVTQQEDSDQPSDGLTEDGTGGGPRPVCLLRGVSASV